MIRAQGAKETVERDTQGPGWVPPLMDKVVCLMHSSYIKKAVGYWQPATFGKEVLFVCVCVCMCVCACARARACMYVCVSARMRMICISKRAHAWGGRDEHGVNVWNCQLHTPCKRMWAGRAHRCVQVPEKAQP
eukprot:1161026-Pelagomonas_calceolata.AAC.2